MSLTVVFSIRMCLCESSVNYSETLILWLHFAGSLSTPRLRPMRECIHTSYMCTSPASLVKNAWFYIIGFKVILFLTHLDKQFPSRLSRLASYKSVNPPTSDLFNVCQTDQTSKLYVKCKKKTVFYDQELRIKRIIPFLEYSLIKSYVRKSQRNHQQNTPESKIRLKWLNMKIPKFGLFFCKVAMSMKIMWIFNHCLIIWIL